MKKQNMQTINVTFSNGQNADYTMQIWDLLVTDPEVVLIVSNETGEILFER